MWDVHDCPIRGGPCKPACARKPDLLGLRLLIYPPHAMKSPQAAMSRLRMPATHPRNGSALVSALFRLTAVWMVVSMTGIASAEGIVAFTEPYRTAVLVPSESGNLEAIEAEVGARVTSGQVLGSLDCEILRVQRKIALAKAEATGELQAAKAELKVRQSLYERYQALRKESNEASELEVERKRADFEIQEAKVRSVDDLLALHRLEVELLDAQIRKRELVSPIDGVISSVDFEAGDFVAPGQNKPVVTIVEIDRLRATFHVPSQQAVHLAVGDKALLQLVQTAQTTEGKIESISPVTDPRTGTVQVRIVVSNSSHTIRSGWRCEFLPAGSSQPATQAKQPDAATVK